MRQPEGRLGSVLNALNEATLANGQPWTTDVMDGPVGQAQGNRQRSLVSYDFDTPIERRGGDATKWNRYAGRDILPMWVADMDFAAPPEVCAALHRRIDHGVFGYCEPWPALSEAIVDALFADYAWRIEPEWIVWLPGLVAGLNVVCRAVGEPGDAVLTATPIYPPFLSAPGNSGRELVSVPLELDGARWSWDFDRMEAALSPRTKLFMLCNPHNPVGRAYTVEELSAVATLCERNDLVICSDEIHCALVLEEGAKHVPIAALDEAIALRTITLMAPSKTYNLPGLGCAFAVVSNPRLRRQFKAAARGIVPHVNVLGMVATEAAYRHGAPWLAQLLRYLRSNRERIAAALSGMPKLSTTPVEATYLSWIDARALPVEDPVVFFEHAGVGLSNGADFGAPGFVRLNFGCTNANLDEALRRMARAVERVS